MPDTPRAAEELDLLVLEYLLHTGCDAPAAAMQTHLRQRSRHPSAWRPVGEHVRRQVVQQVMAAFDAGREEELFALWESYVPPLVRKRDRTCLKLEFYVHIFFAVWPMHALNPNRSTAGLSRSMASFRAYLESNGAALSSNAEFLAYYALPYVPQLTEHPAFRELLTLGWAGALRTRVADFLGTMPQLAGEPKLLTVYKSYAGLTVDGAHGVPRNPVEEASSDVRALKERLVESELRLVEAKQMSAQREAALGHVSQDLLRLASEQQLRHSHSPRGAGSRAVLQRAAETLAALGMAAPPHPPPGNVPSPGGPASGGPGFGASDRGADGSPFNGTGNAFGGADGGSMAPPPPRGGAQNEYDAHAEGTAASASRTVPRPRSVPLFAALNYAQVFEDLQSAAPGERALLLQALRWRLMTSTGRQRQLVLATFVQVDLLQAPVLDACLGGDAVVVEQAVRLSNHFASFAAGRAYLLSKEGLLDRLCALLLGEPTDSPTRQNALGALQKLSLRRAPQAAMISNGVIDWLVHVLAEDLDALSEYTVEYATALLMNLSLRVAGKRRCEEPGVDVLKALNRLLEHESPQVRTYVNGTLYSVLTRPALRERALEMGLPAILEALLEHSDEMNARQLEYILPLLTGERPADEGADESEEAAEEVEGEEEEDYDEDEDEDEAELDEESEIPRSGNVPVGEELLASRYMASAYDAQIEANAVAGGALPGPARGAGHPARGSSLKASRRLGPGETEPPQRPVTPKAAGAGDQPPPMAVYEYPLVDGSEDIETTFASRNKLTRTPAPGAHPSALGGNVQGSAARGITRSTAAAARGRADGGAPHGNASRKAAGTKPPPGPSKLGRAPKQTGGKSPGKVRGAGAAGDSTSAVAAGGGDADGATPGVTGTDADLQVSGRDNHNDGGNVAPAVPDSSSRNLRDGGSAAPHTADDELVNAVDDAGEAESHAAEAHPHPPGDEKRAE